MVFDLCKKFGYKIIGVYFDYKEDILLGRVKNTIRSSNVLRTSKNFQELIINQRKRMQPPNHSDFDEFFIIKLEAEVEQLKEKLITKL